MQDNLSALDGEDEEKKTMEEQKITKIARLKASVIKFINTYDTTTYQSKLITHIKALLETSSEWVQKMDRSQEKMYEIPVLDGKIMDLETKEFRYRVPSDLFTKTFNVH